MRDFLPHGQVTGIGSLPHLDAEQAVEFVAQHSPQIPFVPELPQRSPQEESIARVLAPFEDLLTRHNAGHFEVQHGKLDRFLNRLTYIPAEISPSHCAALPYMEQALQAGLFPHARALKAQIVGLTTLAFAIRYEDKSFAEDTMLTLALSGYWQRLVTWQLDWLKQWQLPTMLFFDEPCLVFEHRLPHSAQVIQRFHHLLKEFQGGEVQLGVHTCAWAALESLLALTPDVISFDAYVELEAFLALPDAKTFVQQGGWVALGWVPTWNDLTPFSPTTQLMRLLSLDLEADFLAQLVRQTLVTATCGLGLVTPNTISTTFDLSHQLAQYLQQTAQLMPTISDTRLGWQDAK